MTTVWWAVYFLCWQPLFFWAELKVYSLLFSLGHLTLLFGFLPLARRVNLSEQASIMRYYQAVWGLFFLEYGFFATAGWLASDKKKRSAGKSNNPTLL